MMPWRFRDPCPLCDEKTAEHFARKWQVPVSVTRKRAGEVEDLLVRTGEAWVVEKGIVPSGKIAIKTLSGDLLTGGVVFFEKSDGWVGWDCYKAVSMGAFKIGAYLSIEVTADLTDHEALGGVYLFGLGLHGCPRISRRRP